MPCAPSDISLNIPSGPNPPFSLPFGIPSFPLAPNFSLPLPPGFPEDLIELFKALQMLLPSGFLKAPLNPNFGKDALDSIIKLLDQFLPFLMLYKFLLPILDMIVCIIEVLCAINNPFKLIRAIQRLFRVCIPEFLSLFPIFALILMIISLLLLLLALIEYLIAQLLKLIALILRNIALIAKALSLADTTSILAAARKIGAVLCMFQNLFVALAIFAAIIDVIKEILKLFFAVPPCSDNNGNDQKCCTPDVCPAFIKNNESITASTGTLQYYNEVGINAGLASVLPNLPAQFGDLTVATRPESWQFYDTAASITDAFINITDAYDLPAGTNSIFFPTDANFTAATPSQQAPYLLNMRLFYNPIEFNRVDPKGSRFVRINNCIILSAPTNKLNLFDNSTLLIPNGVLEIAGGSVFEDDGKTVVQVDGKNATLNTFIHLPPELSTVSPPLLPTDGYTFSNLTYTFTIQHEVLLSKSLITLGCIPSVGLDRTFVNNLFNANINFNDLNNLVLPDPNAAQLCLTTGLAALRAGVSAQAVADFQATATACLAKLQDDTNNAVNSLIGIGFDPFHSTFTLTPTLQFTTQPIQVQAVLNQSNGVLLTTNLPATVASDLGNRISANASFGEVGPFIYDGYQFFNANLTSKVAGSGTIQLSFDSKVFSTISLPADLTVAPTITPITESYTFVYAPIASDVKDTAVGDTTGQPRFGPGDVADDASGR